MCPAPPTDPATSPHTNGFTEYLHCANPLRHPASHAARCLRDRSLFRVAYPVMHLTYAQATTSRSPARLSPTSAPPTDLAEKRSYLAANVRKATLDLRNSSYEPSPVMRPFSRNTIRSE